MRPFTIYVVSTLGFSEMGQTYHCHQWWEWKRRFEQLVEDVVPVTFSDPWDELLLRHNGIQLLQEVYARPQLLMHWEQHAVHADVVLLLLDGSSVDEWMVHAAHHLPEGVCTIGCIGDVRIGDEALRPVIRRIMKTPSGAVRTGLVELTKLLAEVVRQFNSQAVTGS